MNPQYTVGELVKIKLTEDTGMIVGVITTDVDIATQISYQVRLKDYNIVNFFENELENYTKEEKKDEN